MTGEEMAGVLEHTQPPTSAASLTPTLGLMPGATAPATVGTFSLTSDTPTATTLTTNPGLTDRLQASRLAHH